jgi:hypothetical protein
LPELVQLFVLGDQYSIPALRLACLQRLNTVLLDKLWSEADAPVLCGVLPLVQNDAACGNEDLGSAANELLSRLAGAFLNLEDVWRGDGHLKHWFCQLPSDLVQRVLASNNLRVVSENTVLVAALSWLRTGGSAASEAERRAVLMAVRLMKLSPWFLSWFIFDVPEAQQLTPKAFVKQLVRCLVSSKQDQERLQGFEEVLRGWSRARGSYADQCGFLHIEASWDQDVIEAAAVKCASDGTPLYSQQGNAQYWAGAMWTPAVSFYKHPLLGTVQLRAGLVASLQIGDTSMLLNEDIVDWSCSSLIGDGTGCLLFSKPEATRAEPAGWFLDYFSPYAENGILQTGRGWGNTVCKDGQLHLGFCVCCYSNQLDDEPKEAWACPECQERRAMNAAALIDVIESCESVLGSSAIVAAHLFISAGPEWCIVPHITEAVYFW